MAPGTYILSTRSRLLAPNNFGYGRFGSSTLYMFDSGTSMATPLTAGAVAVVREYLRKTVKIASPSAALLKAALIAGAQPVRPATVPPDNNQGFGRVNLDNLRSPHALLKAMFIEGKGLATGALEERTVTVAQGGQPLKIVLAYSDFPGPRLVNNLNRRQRPDRCGHSGWECRCRWQFRHQEQQELVLPATLGTTPSSRRLERAEWPAPCPSYRRGAREKAPLRRLP